MKLGNVILRIFLFLLIPIVTLFFFMSSLFISNSCVLALIINIVLLFLGIIIILKGREKPKIQYIEQVSIHCSKCDNYFYSEKKKNVSTKVICPRCGNEGII